MGFEPEAPLIEQPECLMGGPSPSEGKRPNAFQHRTRRIREAWFGADRKGAEEKSLESTFFSTDKYALQSKTCQSFGVSHEQPVHVSNPVDRLVSNGSGWFEQFSPVPTADGVPVRGQSAFA